MELITGEDGNVAPRLSEVSMPVEQALEDHDVMMQYVVRMLCAGVIHGDLSEFNVLVDEYGPVVIDMPQAVNAAANNNAEAMLKRDVNNMREYYGRFAPELLTTRYADEIWALYAEGELTPETELTGEFKDPSEAADVDGVLQEIIAAMAEEEERLERIRAAEESD